MERLGMKRLGLSCSFLVPAARFSLAKTLATERGFTFACLPPWGPPELKGEPLLSFLSRTTPTSPLALPPSQSLSPLVMSTLWLPF